MKVKVIKTFKDRITKSVLRPEQIIEITEERFEEINSTSFGILVEEIKELSIDPPENLSGEENATTIVESQTNAGETESSNFEKMTKPELVEYAKSLNIELDTNMKKTEMIEILLKE